MKVAVLFHEFEPFHEFKDPGQLVVGLCEIGVSAEMVTWRKRCLQEYSGIPLRAVEVGETARESFWRGAGYDVVVAYTWLREDRLWIPRVLKAGAQRVVVKADTDGNVGWPLYPMWNRWIGVPIGPSESAKILWRRVLGWVRARSAADRLAEHIGLVNGVVVETPQALAGIGYILTVSDHEKLIEKLHWLPNPVVDNCNELPVGNKEKTIVAVGNWTVRFGAYFQKNPEVLCRSLAAFLTRRRDYRAVVIGAGRDLVTRLLGHRQGAERIVVRGETPHDDVLRELSRARTLFMPSIAEMFPIAAAEAVCLGCSVVGSSLGCFQYLTRGGANGVLASDFDPGAFHAALLADANRWDRGEYHAEEISGYWRARLSRIAVAKRLAGVLVQVAARG